jgi:hypothetical protein
MNSKGNVSIRKLALTPALSPRRDHPEFLSRLAPLNRIDFEAVEVFGAA